MFDVWRGKVVKVVFRDDGRDKCVRGVLLDFDGDFLRVGEDWVVAVKDVISVKRWYEDGKD